MITTNCELCEEPYDKGDHVSPMNGGARWAHRECMLRCVVGGIGHLENHSKWCIEEHDPDGGRTYRMSSLAVDQWVQENWGQP